MQPLVFFRASGHLVAALVGLGVALGRPFADIMHTADGGLGGGCLRSFRLTSCGWLQGVSPVMLGFATPGLLNVRAAIYGYQPERGPSITLQGPLGG